MLRLLPLLNVCPQPYNDHLFALQQMNGFFDLCVLHHLNLCHTQNDAIMIKNMIVPLQMLKLWFCMYILSASLCCSF